MKNKISNIVIIILSTIIVVYIGLMVFGYRIYAVKTSSMYPDIPKGSVAIAKKLSPDEVFEELELGNDIVYRTSSGSNLTHRVIMLDEENGLIQTQGIREGSAKDTVIGPTSVLGKVSFSIPIVGYLVMFIQSQYFLIFALCGIAMYVIIKLIIKQLKNN